MEEKAIVAALAKAKQQFRQPKQSGLNTFFKGPSNPRGTPYSTVGDIDAAISEALTANGFAPMTVHPRLVDGLWFAEGCLRHRSGEEINASVPLFFSKQDMQGFKSALTYAHRMLLICLTGALSGCDDDDANAVSQPQEVKPAAKNPRAVLEAAATENELRKALAERNAELSQRLLDKFRLFAKRGEVDQELLHRAEQAYERAFAEEVVNG
jgi:hypothetical protein